MDVELWPWGMDGGHAYKKLEISTSSDPLTPQSPGPNQGPGQGQGSDQTRGRGEGQQRDQQCRVQCQRPYNRSSVSNGHPWSLQAQQWGERSADEPQQSLHNHSLERTRQRQQQNSETSHPEPEFKLVGRCELREETLVCFSHPRFHPRSPFPSLPPLPPTSACRREELWNRGALSLGSVTQLRVTVPFMSAGSALGLKTLAVWGQPARCCRAEEVERVKRAHEASLKRLPSHSGFFVSSANQPPQLLSAAATTPRCVELFSSSFFFLFHSMFFSALIFKKYVPAEEDCVLHKKGIGLPLNE